MTPVSARSQSTSPGSFPGSELALGKSLWIEPDALDHLLVALGARAARAQS